ncbi:MAG: hypothetical protein ACLPTF_15970 [Steroidobacteraceae bacterium]
MPRLQKTNTYSGKVGRFAITGVVFFLSLWGPAGAAIAPAPPTPEEGTTFDLFVGDQYTYDDNLYRIPANFGTVSLIAPNATRADRINTLVGGGFGQWIFGQQDIDLTLRADNNRFAHNTGLDNTGGDALLNWTWVVGPYFSGQVGGEFNRALASFAETRYLGRDMVDQKEYFGSAKFQVGPHWSIFGGVRGDDITHGAEAAAFNDFRTKSGNVGVQYATGISDTFGLEYRYSDGIYPPNYTFEDLPFNRNFTEDTYRATVNYAITEKFAVDAYAGYMSHTLPSSNILSSAVFGDFKGNIWRVTLNWQPTEKTQLLVASWHELHAYLVNASNYFISKGGSISPIWKPTGKVTVGLVLSLEDQSYSNLNTILASLLAPRYDKVTGEQINVNYLPRDRWSINLFFRHEHRDSNEPQFSYEDRLANISVTYKFW